MAQNVSQLVQALDALDARVDAASKGSIDEGLRMFKALANMVKSGVVLQDTQAVAQAAAQQQHQQQTEQQFQCLENTQVTGIMQTSHEGTLNAVMNALMEHRANQANTKRELPILDLMNQRFLPMANRASSCGMRGSSVPCPKHVLEPVRSSRIS